MSTPGSFDDSIAWIRELVRLEEQMEEAGVVDLDAANSDRVKVQESLKFLQNMKNKFIEASGTFNELKNSALGRLKIYGIAQTHADFMLFRNGYKMIFSLNAPGEISIRFNFLGAGSHIPSQIPSHEKSVTGALFEEQLIHLHMGPFGTPQWKYQDQPIAIDDLVRYHMSLFIRESAK